jgi:hypothetical protein
MISSKKLTKWLFIADASVGCDVCGGSTWESSLSGSQIYKEQLWHDPSCPLYARKDVFDEWSNEDGAPTGTWRGQLQVCLRNMNGADLHTLWLKHDNKQLSRLVPIHDDFDHIDTNALDGLQVTILGTMTVYKSDSTIYFSMLLDRK